jgi:hypothetical protein
MNRSRWSEPSTWAGVGAVLGALAQSFPPAAMYLVPLAAIAGAIAVALRERGGDDSQP